jgi:hypothetical protein
MTTDLYTKAVLTVIALALSAIALQHSLTPAYAQQGFRFSSNGALVVAIEGLRLSSNGLMPVLICDRQLRGGDQLWCADVDDLKRK